MFNKVSGLLDYLLNPRKDIEIFGMFGPGNLGDEAMLVAALATLPAHRCVSWKSYPQYPMLDTLLKKKARKHLLVAGGTLIHGGDTAWLDYVEMRAMQGSEVSFLGTGIAFNDHEVGQSDQWNRWGYVLRGAKEVHLRGPASVDFASRMGARADVFGDFAFLLHEEAIPLKNHEDRDAVIGVNLGYCLGDQQRFEDTAVELLNRISTDHRIVFHAVVRSDLEVIGRVAARAGLDAGRARIEEHYFDPLGFMWSIRCYRAFIGLKLHAAGLAMVAGLPTVMLAYLPKCHDFMAPLEAPNCVVVDLPMKVEAVISSLEQVLAKPADYVVEGKIGAVAAQQRRTLKKIYLSDLAS